MPEPTATPRSFMDRVRLVYAVWKNTVPENAPAPQQEKAGPWRGLAIAGAVGLVQGLLLLLWAMRDSSMAAPSAVGDLSAARFYADALSSGQFLSLLPSPTAPFITPAPPLYRWFLMPAVRLFPAAPETAAVMTNAFFLVLLCMAVYMVVRKSRCELAAVTGAAFVSALPTVLGAAQQISSLTALMAVTAGAYASFIWSEDFEKTPWTYVWGLFMLAGTMLSWVFILCALPLFNFMVYGAMNPTVEKHVRRILIAWLAVAGALALANLEPLSQMLFGMLLNGSWQMSPSQILAGWAKHVLDAFATLKWYLFGAADAVQLLFAAPILVFGAWFMLARSGVVAWRRDVFYWFAAPLLALCLLPVRDMGYFAPAIPACAVAVGVMLPAIARLPALLLLFVFSASYQLGVVPDIKVRLLGRPSVFSASSRPHTDAGALADMIADIRTVKPQAALLPVAVFNSPELKSVYLNWKARVSGFGSLDFADAGPSFPLYPEFVLLPSAMAPSVAAAAPSVSSGTVAGLSASVEREEVLSALPSLYLKAKEYRISGENVSLYALRVASQPPLQPGVYDVVSFNFAGFKLQDLTLSLGPWNAQKGVYERVSVSVGAAMDGEARVYGIKLVADDVDFVTAEPGRLNGLKLLRLGGLRISGGLASEKDLPVFLSRLMPKLRGPAMSVVENGVVFGASSGGVSAIGRFVLEGGDAKQRVLRCSAMKLAGFYMPGFLLGGFSWPLESAPSARRPFRLAVDGLYFYQDTISITPPPSAAPQQQ